MAWHIDQDRVTFRHPLEGGVTVSFEAADIRREPTGIHSRISIYQDQLLLAFSNFNAERGGDRQWLANRAWEKLGKAEQEGIGERLFKHEFDLFCAELWTRWLSRFEAEDLEPDEGVGPVGFCLTPYVLQEGGVIQFGVPGAGKSWFLYLMAQSIAHGCDTIWPCEQKKILVVNLERPKRSVQRRLACVNRVLGLEPRAPLPILNVRGYSFSDVEPIVRREMEKRKAEVLLVDSLSRTGFGKLGFDDVANQAMDTFNHVAESWFLIAHPPRQDSSHIFGSVMFDAAADLTLKAWSQEKQNGMMGLAVKGEKANDLPKPPLRIYACEFDKDGLAGFRVAEKGEFRDLEGGDPASLSDEVADLLRMTGAMSATEIASELERNRSNVSTLLAKDDRFAASGRNGKSVLYDLRKHEGNR